MMFSLLQTPSERTYQYAWKDLSFLGFQRSKCPDCSRTVAATAHSSPRCLLLEGGPKYPDYLAFCGAGEPLFVISERAASVFRANDLLGIAECVPIQVAKEENGVLIPLPENAPNYVMVQITGKIDLDYEKMGLKKKKVCSTCGSFEWNRQRLYPLYMDEHTWDGSDICRNQSLPGYIIFSKVAVELIKKHKLKGFCLKSL